MEQHAGATRDRAGHRDDRVRDAREQRRAPRVQRGEARERDERGDRVIAADLEVRVVEMDVAEVAEPARDLVEPERGHDAERDEREDRPVPDLAHERRAREHDRRDDGGDERVGRRREVRARADEGRDGRGADCEDEHRGDRELGVAAPQRAATIAMPRWSASTTPAAANASGPSTPSTRTIATTSVRRSRRTACRASSPDRHRSTP